WLASCRKLHGVAALQPVGCSGRVVHRAAYTANAPAAARPQIDSMPEIAHARSPPGLGRAERQMPPQSQVILVAHHVLAIAKEGQRGEPVPNPVHAGDPPFFPLPENSLACDDFLLLWNQPIH